MHTFDGVILGNPVRVVAGDVATVGADGVVVPHFKGAASFAGVGGAIARAGAAPGMRAYQRHLESTFPPPDFGSVVVTRSGGGAAWWLFHATTVGAGRDHDAVVVRRTVRVAMGVARARDVTSLTVPLLGTGAAGSLDTVGSATTILSGVADHVARGGRPVPTRIVVAGGSNVMAEVVGVILAGGIDGDAGWDDADLVRSLSVHQEALDALPIEPEED